MEGKEKIPVQTDRERKEEIPVWANETFWQFLKRTVPRDWPYIKEDLKEQLKYAGITAAIASFFIHSVVTVVIIETTTATQAGIAN